jgi:hypothetical protein
VNHRKILKIACQQARLTDADALKLTKKPPRMTLGADFCFSKEHTQTRPAVTSPKPKQRTVPLGPDKLTGDGSGIQKIYHKGVVKSAIPGIVGQDVLRRDFKDISVRAFDPGEETTTVEIVIKDEMELAATVRKQGRQSLKSFTLRLRGQNFRTLTDFGSLVSR